MWRAAGEIDKAYAVFERHLPTLRRNAELLRQLDAFCEEIWQQTEQGTYSDIVTDQSYNFV